ncbi:hypothetical protein ALC57_05212 [Trachymyrmex cornetzi]|uniref:Uncharacterized protein n=1 Tax=Trachymyrmex cornetzi TaxID=471704 RepID=A0A151JBE1_9HYME|nr:hypothetical protein ALC57_05212 [Trachymyrmex cornetzi]
MYLALYHPSNFLDLSIEQLQYIPKVVLFIVAATSTTISPSGGSLLNRAINALSFELHIPGYQICGLGTRLTNQLDRGDTGINKLDAAGRENDIEYSRSNDLTDRYAANKVLTYKALGRVAARDSVLSERAAAAAVWTAIKTKTKIGMSMKPKKKTTRKKRTKKRILRTAKRGGALPFLPMLGALGFLIGGAVGVAKAVNGSKAARHQLEELRRHNRAMQQGRGLYLAPHKYGRGQ